MIEDFLLETLLSSLRFQLNSSLAYSNLVNKLDLKNTFIQMNLLEGKFDLLDFDKLFPKYHLLQKFNLKMDLHLI